MKIEVTCRCGRRYRVDAAMKGRRVRCAACCTTFRVGGSEAEAPDDPTLSAPPRGRSFGNYWLYEMLGEGGVGTVYKGYHIPSAQWVAVKMLRRPAGAADEDPAVRRFLREAEALGQLVHRNIVIVNEVGAADGVHYISMEWIQGSTLADLTRRKLDPRKGIEWMAQICDAVEVCHAGGIIHRDLKPSNVMIDRRGWPVLMDFGLARFAGSEIERTMLTQAGDVIGTPLYMSPEQAQGEAVGKQTDIYSIGVILYEIVAGRAPFEASTSAEILARIVGDPPPKPGAAKRGLKAALDDAILTAMHPYPQFRFASAAELGATLRSHLS